MKQDHRIAAMKFSKVYPLYVQKAERKGRSRAQVDQVIGWLTGYTQAGLQQQLRNESDFETFFAQAPALHPNRALIKGLICGVRVEDIADPLVQNVRYAPKFAVMLRLLSVLLLFFPVFTSAAESACPMDKAQAETVTKLFSGTSHVYSLLWWSDPESTTINARSFVINGHDSVPVFSSKEEGAAQIAGSGYEKDLVGVAPGLLAAILQGMEYAVLNPGGQHPIQFKTCILTPFVKVPGA